MQRLETALEKILFGSRWLLLPIHLGLVFALIALSIKFFQEVFHILPHILDVAETELVLTILSMIDLVLIGGLLVMVMLSSYENFVSRLDIASEDKLGWLGKLDPGSLKLKVAAAIVAISSIHMLKAFMNIGSLDAEKLQWYVIMHLTFVVSAVLMGWLDKLTRH